MSQHQEIHQQQQGGQVSTRRHVSRQSCRHNATNQFDDIVYSGR